MRAPNFNPSQLEGMPEGMWVAMSCDQSRVVATGKTLDEAIKGAAAAGEDSPPCDSRLPTEPDPCRSVVRREAASQLLSKVNFARDLDSYLLRV